MKINHSTDCNGKAHVVTIDTLRLFISYETCIAASYFDGEVLKSARVENSWEPTTGKHFYKLGAAGFPIVTDEALERFVEHALWHIGMKHAKNMLGA